MRTEEKTHDSISEECFVDLGTAEELQNFRGVVEAAKSTYSQSSSSDEETASLSSVPSHSCEVGESLDAVAEIPGDDQSDTASKFVVEERDVPNNRETNQCVFSETTNQKANPCVLTSECNRVAFVKTESFHANLSEPLKNLLQGLNVPGDSNCPLDSQPDWLDMEKFRRGQEFAKNHISGLNFANMLSLFLGFSFRRLFEPLIYTTNSDTPFKAFKRYLSTVNRLTTWYEGNIWDTNDPAHKNLRTVRSMHRNVMKRINSVPPEELDRLITLEGPGGNSSGMWCPMTKDLQDDFRETCPRVLPGQCPYGSFANSGKGTYYISQFDMAMTQFEFVGLMVLYPKKFGASRASDEDLEAFLHFWRGAGYLLGIDDKFNFCRGTLEETRQLTDDIIQYWIKPNLRDISRDTEHMYRCIVEGISYYMPGLTVRPVLMYACWVIGVTARRLAAALTWREYFALKYFQFAFLYASRVPGANSLANWYVTSRIKIANKASPSWLEEKQNKVYSYQIHAESVCTKL